MKDEGERMKTYFVSLLLLFSVLSLVVMMDVIMGTKFNEIIPKLRKPFEVSEPTEYFITFTLLAYLFLKPIIVFLIKKKMKSSSS